MTEVTSTGLDWRANSLVRRLHGWNARILVVFIAAHFVNHSFVLAGPLAHLEFMDRLRVVYRLPVVEYLLWGLLLGQIVLGLVLARKNWRPTSPWAWAQVVSGLLIAMFLLQHLAAAFYVRTTVHFIDTDIYWAASVVSSWPLAAYFVPYYVLGMSAVFTHIAAALHFAKIGSSVRLPLVLAVNGIVFSIVIVAGLAGWFNTITLPEGYLRYLAEF